MLTATVLALLSAANELPTSSTEFCELHVWQTENYISTAPAPYFAYGGLGAALQSLHDSNYPADSVVGVMDFELKAERLKPLLEKVDWQGYLGGNQVQVIVEPQIIDKSFISKARSARVRNSQSQAPCYAELYLSDQSFEGGFIKSHLFNNLTIRDFRNGGYSTANAIVWNQLKGFPAKDEASLPVARENFREAFVKNIVKFLDKKFPRKPSKD